MSATAVPRLSKSRVQSGHQCALRLWKECFEPEQAAPPDARTRTILDRGTRVGELARDRYPGGRLIAAGSGSAWRGGADTELALELTRRALTDPDLATVPALYEAAIAYRNVVARVDVLARVVRTLSVGEVRTPSVEEVRTPPVAGTPGGSAGDAWDLIEVKASTRAKDVFVRDLAVQVYIARGAGLRVRRAGLLLLDRDYLYDGVRLDLDALFRFDDLTAQVDAMHGEIGAQVDSLQAMLASGAAPEIQPGDHCGTPYPCPFLARCTTGRVAPSYPVSELPRLRPKRLGELLELGIEEIHEIPSDFPLNALQARVRACVLEEKEYVSPALAAALERIVHPVHHLDFETFMPAIPLFADTHPYDPVPFQYSLHVEDENAAEHPAALRHVEYLHESRSAPYHALAARLLADVGTHGSICVYTGYEARMIELLAQHVPERAGELAALAGRLWDLHPIVRDHYYHPGFRGSFSIKAVVPVLAPHLSYAALEIGDGMLASNAFEASLALQNGPERDAILRALRAYCATDTLAMVAIRRALARCARVGRRSSLS